jgi:hypothetical protein
VNHTQTSSTSVTPAPRPPSHQRPWFAYSGWLLSALQIPLTIYFYRLSVITPEFTSHVHPTRTPIVKALKESRLQVSYDGQPITNDVTAVQIAIWNAGRQSIRPQHLLKPVELLLTNSTRILEAKVLKSSRDVTRLAAMVPITDPGHVQLSWDILEHNDGGILQIIYSGPPRRLSHLHRRRRRPARLSPHLQPRAYAEKMVSRYRSPRLDRRAHLVFQQSSHQDFLARAPSRSLNRRAVRLYSLLFPA